MGVSSKAWFVVRVTRVVTQSYVQIYFLERFRKLPLKVCSERILSVDEDSESSANVANSDLIGILNSDNDNSDILLPVRRRWKPFNIEDDTDDEDHSNHRQSDARALRERIQGDTNRFSLGRDTPEDGARRRSPERAPANRSDSVSRWGR
ncbi:unnamed protein product [Xylocopa violacea]|uniref:Uncharacterized protein n=1 Tax=Xylocopa violacea TaxID=135666 RepID=A0ABP1P2K0_XYLVO